MSNFSFFITIRNEKCFKTFASKFFKGFDSNGISFALDEIHRMKIFQPVQSIAFDISDAMTSAQNKEKFFFGGRDYISVIWDDCILSKIEADKSTEEGDASNLMQLEILERLSRFMKQIIHYLLIQMMILWTFSYIIVAVI